MDLKLVWKFNGNCLGLKLLKAMVAFVTGMSFKRLLNKQIYYGN